MAEALARAFLAAAPPPAARGGEGGGTGLRGVGGVEDGRLDLRCRPRGGRIAGAQLRLESENVTDAVPFWHRAVAWFASIGIRCERVITDNGSCYRSWAWHDACAAAGTTVKKTRLRRPQTNGKVERYHRILLEERAYIRPWTSEHQRHLGYTQFVHFYNHHRSHGALDWATPIDTLRRLNRDN